MSKKRKNV